MDIKAKSEVFGAVYAPNSVVQIFNDADIYGAIVAQSFGMKNSGNFYYVAERGKAGLNDEAAYFQILRWWK